MKFYVIRRFWDIDSNNRGLNRVFYSWQSDLPNNTNRTFIENCIKKAIKTNASFMEMQIYFDYDRDTKDVTGSPDISETIFNKIEKSDLFICDISIINSNYDGRKTPNPNVLLELGYAAKVLGWEKVLCLFNLKYGTLEDLPFDLNHKRILMYNSGKYCYSHIYSSYRWPTWPASILLLAWKIYLAIFMTGSKKKVPKGARCGN